MQNKLFLRELRSVKDNGEFVSVTFTNGLNVISGISNTGKSYILQCIDYVLGAQTKPKVLKNYSTTYKYLLLQIECSNGNKFVLKRDFEGKNSSKVFLYHCDIDKVENCEGLKLTAKKSDSENLSDIILKKIDLDKVELLGNKKTGKNCYLSLRLLLNFILIDEVSIIQVNSPIYKNGYGKALKESLFKYLISGEDNSSQKITVDSAQIYKAKLQAKISMLEKLINKNLEEIKSLNINDEFIDIESKHKELKEQIEKTSRAIEEHYEKKNKVQYELEIKQNKYIEISRLINKYNLLKEFYNNNIERYNFIAEGTYYLEQLNNDVECPICHQHQISQNINTSAIKMACKAEAQKNILKLTELDEIIENSNKEKESLEKEFASYKIIMQNLETKLNKELLPSSNLLKNAFNNILLLQNNKNKKKWLQNENYNYRNLKQEYENAIENYKSSTFEQKISSEAYINFADEITKILKAWNYIDEHGCIDFHEKEMDICINGEPRKNTGKGHRALTYTAFIISLLKFAKKHIGFVMIDSPLLNLREVDENNPTVSPEIKNAFWKDLAETKNDSQIIIIENNEPPINIQQKINYIKFTNDETIGRRGFY